MSALLVDLGTLKQGEDNTITVTCQTDNPAYDPVQAAADPEYAVPKYLPKDLTGYTNPECEIRAQDKLTGELLLTATPAFEPDRTTGQISFDIPFEATIAQVWNFKVAFFDLFVYRIDGKRICVAECSFAMDPTTTRPTADR